MIPQIIEEFVFLVVLVNYFAQFSVKDFNNSRNKLATNNRRLLIAAEFHFLCVQYNIDQYQYQFSCASKVARKCNIEHWLPCGADGWSLARLVYGHVITKFSGMGRFT